MKTNETLPSWFYEFTSCNKCSNGFIIGSDSAIKCDCKIQYDNKIKLLYSLMKSNILSSHSSKDILSYIDSLSFDSYKGPDKQGNISKLKKFISKFDEKYSSLNLYFFGAPGTQKSTIAKTIIKMLCIKHTCYYVLANDLIQLIIDSSRDEEKKTLLHSILSVDLLIIDEMDEDKIITYASGWQRKNFFPFIKNRLEHIRKSTIFISNETIENIGSYFEGAIQDLINRSVPDPMTFSDKYFTYKEKLDINSIWED